MGENENMAQAPSQDAGKRPWNALDEWKLRLIGRVLDGAKKNSTLKLAMIANQLRFQAFTNIENDPTGGKVEAKLGAYDMYAVFKVIENAAANRDFKALSIPCKTGPESEQVLESTIIIGRDSEQCIFIALKPGPGSQCQTNMSFQFYPSSYHSLQRADGQETSKAEISEYWTFAWLELMRNLCGSVLAFSGKDRSGQENVNGEALAERPKQQWQGGGQKKPWQGNGGGGGGYQKKPWQGNNGGGGYQKKPWQGNGGGGGGYQKKPWQGNNGGGGNNNYQQKSSNGYSGDISVNEGSEGFEDGIPF